MSLWGSLLCSQGLFPESDESIPHSYSSYLVYIHIHILLSMPRSSRWSLSFRFFHQTLACTAILHISSLTIQRIFREEYKSWSSSLWNFFPNLLLLPPSATEQFRLQPRVLPTQQNAAMRTQNILPSSCTEHGDVSSAALTARESLMKDWPSELAALRVAPMGNNRGPGNDGDDYLSIFNPSSGALLVRLQVVQHFTMTVATRHILQMKQRSRFLSKSSKRVCINCRYFCKLF